VSPTRVVGERYNLVSDPSFNTEPGWATNVEFEVKIPQGFDVQRARRVLGEHLGCVQKIGRYNSLINPSRRGIGPQS
jgi:hypothetical protein